MELAIFRPIFRACYKSNDHQRPVKKKKKRNCHQSLNLKGDLLLSNGKGNGSLHIKGSSNAV